MNKRNFLYWLPRILAILFILFISLFALDVFSEGYSFWETCISLFMHLVPSFILIAITLLAWRWEHVGGGLFILMALLYFVIAGSKFDAITLLIIGGPPILIGFLFLLNKFFIHNKKGNLNQEYKIQ